MKERSSTLFVQEIKTRKLKNHATVNSYMLWHILIKEKPWDWVTHTHIFSSTSGPFDSILNVNLSYIFLGKGRGFNKAQNNLMKTDKSNPYIHSWDSKAELIHGVKRDCKNHQMNSSDEIMKVLFFLRHNLLRTNVPNKASVIVGRWIE